MDTPHIPNTPDCLMQLLENPLFHRILDVMQTGVSITDPTGTIKFFSKSCYTVHGLNPQDSVVGKNIGEVFCTADSGVLKSLETGQATTINSVARNGVEALCRRYPILDDNRVICCVAEVLATTHQNNQLDELLKRLQQLKNKSGYVIGKESSHRGALCTFESLIGDTRVMQKLKKMGRRFARSQEPVLILGESGTGKELLAQAIHTASSRAEGAFVSVNCAALPRELAESELFGYVEGAFTGAKKGGKKGKFELADNGTIFLDEIAELPLHLQAKFLRVLENNEIQKIGMGQSQYSNFRLIAATNRDLPELIRQGQFREDLYHRLNILELRLPSLRQRRGDIPALIAQLIERICGPQKALSLHLSPEVLKLFMHYPWPGNVRELKNVLAYAYCCMDDNEVELGLQHLPERMFTQPQAPSPAALELKGGMEHGRTGLHAAPEAFSFRRAQGDLERHAIEAALNAAGGNKSRATRTLGIARNTLYLKMKALGLPLHSEKRSRK